MARYIERKYASNVMAASQSPKLFVGVQIPGGMPNKLHDSSIG